MTSRTNVTEAVYSWNNIKELVYALLVFMLLAFLCSYAEAAEKETIKSYSFRYMDTVLINVTDEPCPEKSFSTIFPQAALAQRIDGEYLGGCYRIEDDTIYIKWEDKFGLKGEITPFPANGFKGFPIKEFKGEF